MDGWVDGWWMDGWMNGASLETAWPQRGSILRFSLLQLTHHLVCGA